MAESILWSSARDQVDAVVSGRISAAELMAATYDRLEAVNPGINALVSVLDREDALALARVCDDRRRTDGPAGVLEGLPMAPKDLIDAVGFPTTMGFVPFRDQMPAADSDLVARQKAAGAIVFAKTNVPEFGFGSHTFNNVFGITRNPYDVTKSAGGSSGGAAAALGAGIVAVADGSDFGGSLRNPASFCNVVGFRPSIGRVNGARGMGWLGRIATNGPMARCVDDVARLLSVQVAPDLTDPMTLADPGETFMTDLRIDPTGLRIACTADLGFLPVDGPVRDVFATVGPEFEAMGATVAEAYPDLTRAMEVFQAQRAANVALTARMLERDVPDWRSFAKDTALWNFDKGTAITANEILMSEVLRLKIYEDMVGFFERYDALVLPTAQVLPFDVETPWVASVDGVDMPTYLDWMSICCVISVTGLPAISIPAGFSSDGLPVGIQIVGPPRGDLAVLRIASAFEAATGFANTRPRLAD